MERRPLSRRPLRRAALAQGATNQRNADKKRKGAVPDDPSETKRQAVGADPTPAPAEDLNFEQELAEQNRTISEVLNRKITFRRTVKAEKKLETLTPHYKELRSAGVFLLSERERLEKDGEELRAKILAVESEKEREEKEFENQKSELGKTIEELKESVAKGDARANELENSVEGLKHDAEKVKNEKRDALREVDDLKRRLETTSEELQAKGKKVASLEENVKNMQAYHENLQNYNANLQTNLRRAEEERVKFEKENLAAKGTIGTLEGSIGMLEKNAATVDKQHKACQEQVGHLRRELDQAMATRDKYQKEAEKWQTEAEQFREHTGKSIEELEKMENRKAAIEGQYEMQNEVMDGLRREARIMKEQKKIAEDCAEKRAAEVQDLTGRVEKLQGQLQEAEEKLIEHEVIRRKLHNTILELKGNIRVFCRVRPAAQDEPTLEPGTEKRIITYPTKGDLEGRGINLLSPPGPTQPFQEFNFTFDQIFNQDAGQEKVFDDISQLVQSALDGYKVCIFAYGQTGSGKTYTMLGSKEQRGIIPRAMEQIFKTSGDLEANGWKFAMHASMLEIYNEEYKDLLGKSLPAGKRHQVAHDSNGNTTVSELTLVNVREAGKVDQLLTRAMEKRSVGATLLNDQSSRSHMVFSLKIEGVNTASDQRVHGVLNLIDLAGSERVKESGATGVRLKEAQNINKSLSALGDVILALANKGEHVPYRNSKLTWLLQPCLGGDAKTLMFVNVSPNRDSAHESLCSLRFASKVNACEIGVARRTVKAAD